MQTIVLQAVLWQHALNGLLEGSRGLALHQTSQINILDAARVTGVVVVDLVFELIAGNRDLLGVDNYDVITAVEVRCVLRLVLAHEAGSNLGSQAAKGLAFGVDNVPIVRKFGSVSYTHL